jgi:hypothetical protein
LPEVAPLPLVSLQPLIFEKYFSYSFHSVTDKATLSGGSVKKAAHPAALRLTPPPGKGCASAAI